MPLLVKREEESEEERGRRETPPLPPTIRYVGNCTVGIHRNTTIRNVGISVYGTPPWESLGIKQ